MKVKYLYVLFLNVLNGNNVHLKHAVWRYFWNCRKHFEHNVSKACALKVFETIWNCRERKENTVSKACILLVSETIWNFRKIIENNVYKTCIIGVFETISNYRKNGKIWKQGRLRAQYDTLVYDILTWRHWQMYYK